VAVGEWRDDGWVLGMAEAVGVDVDGSGGGRGIGLRVACDAQIERRHLPTFVCVTRRQSRIKLREFIVF
jgi:hypothetical protein